MPDTLSATIQLTIIAMGVVFAVLTVLGLIITLMRLACASRTSTGQPVGPKPGEDPVPGDEGDESTDAPAAVDDEAVPDEILVVISAAIAAYTETPEPRTTSTEKRTANPWLIAGRQELMASRTMGRK